MNFPLLVDCICTNLLAEYFCRKHFIESSSQRSDCFNVKQFTFLQSLVYLKYINLQNLRIVHKYGPFRFCRMDQKFRRRKVGEKLSLVPGKLDHATVTAYSVADRTKMLQSYTGNNLTFKRKIYLLIIFVRFLGSWTRIY